MAAPSLRTTTAAFGALTWPPSLKAARMSTLRWARCSPTTRRRAPHPPTALCQNSKQVRHPALAVLNRASYFDEIIALFGYDRLLAESNWFVGSSDSSRYDAPYTLLLEACERAGATDAEKEMVFSGNARRAYRLGQDVTQPAAKM